jgi:hypothetical protein
MNYPRVVAGLMPAQKGLFFSHQNCGIGVLQLQLPGGGNAHDAASDDCEIDDVHDVSFSDEFEDINKKPRDHIDILKLKRYLKFE